MAANFNRKPMSAENALVRLQDFCVRAEHCGFELREKLRGWMVPVYEWDNILQKLQKDKFYDDRRFASAFVRDKVLYNKWGRRKIVVAMMAKRIDRSIIDNALDEIDMDTYRSILLAFMQSRCRSIKEGNTFEGRTKLFRAAVSRGYEPTLVSDIIRNHNEQLWDGCPTC